MVSKPLKSTRTGPNRRGTTISLAPLNFEEAIRAAMATGKPAARKPKAKNAQKAKRKGKK